MGTLCKFFMMTGKFSPAPKVLLDDAGRFLGRCHIRKEERLTQKVSFFVYKDSI